MDGSIPLPRLINQPSAPSTPLFVAECVAFPSL